MNTKVGWTSYEEVLEMGTRNIVTIGKVVKVGQLKSKERNSMKRDSSISYGNTSLGILGVVLFNKESLLKFAVTKLTASKLIESGIISDIKISNNKIDTRYDKIGKYPRYTNIEDLTTLIDFVDGEMLVCIGINRDKFVVVIPGNSCMYMISVDEIMSRVRCLGPEIGIPANLSIKDNKYYMNKAKW